MACFFGRTPVPAVYVSDTELACRPPFITNTSTLDVTISGYDGFIADGTIFVSCHDTPVIQRIEPSSGSAAGGTIVTVELQDPVDLDNVEDIRCCYIPTVCSVASMVNASTAQCVTPPLNAGSRSLKILLGSQYEGLVNSSEVSFKIIVEPQISNVLPLRALLAPHLTLSVYGGPFVNSDTLKCILVISGGDSYELAAQWRSVNLLTCSVTHDTWLTSIPAPAEAQVQFSLNGQDVIDTGFNITLLRPLKYAE